MQSEVIDGILTVEDEAAKRIADAEKKARDEVSQAHDQAAKIIADALDEVRERGNADVESAEALLQQHLQQYEEERSRIEAESNSVDPDVLDRAATRIVDRLLHVDSMESR